MLTNGTRSGRWPRSLATYKKDAHPSGAIAPAILIDRSVNMGILPRKWLFRLANALALVVLVLLLLDPTRPLVPIFILLAVAVGLLWWGRSIYATQ
jgi:hypothetical protein